MDIGRVRSTSPVNQPQLDKGGDISQRSGTPSVRAGSSSLISKGQRSPTIKGQAGEGSSIGLPNRPRSLSEERIRAQSPVDENDEPIISMRQFERSLENFGEFFASHTTAMADEMSALKGTMSNLSESLNATKQQKSKLEQSISARKAGSRERAISRESTIKDLQEENKNLLDYTTQADNFMSHLQGSLGTMSFRLENMDTEIDRKSNTISSQTKAISTLEKRTQDIKSSHTEELEKKDSVIIGLEQQIKDLKLMLDSKNQENGLLKYRLDIMESAEKEFTPSKSAAIEKTGKQIADQSEVLQKLNSKLLDERKTLVAENKQNKDEIAQLKSRVVQVARLAGIELPE